MTLFFINNDGGGFADRIDVPEGSTVVVNMCGRGDKDVEQIMHILGDEVGGGARAALNRDLPHGLAASRR